MGLFEKFVGPRLTEVEIRRRQVAVPLVKAELGAQAVRVGRMRDDVELRQIGAAMVVSAFVSLDDQERDVVTKEVSDAITGIAATLPRDEVVSNPLVSPAAAEKVAPLLEVPRGQAE